jgi:hypothetical protein
LADNWITVEYFYGKLPQKITITRFKEIADFFKKKGALFMRTEWPKARK